MKHDWVSDDFRPDCFYFITIRNPIDMWSSLYRYGLDEKGSLYNQIKIAGFLSCYESFEKFVTFCLKKRNGKLLGFGYTNKISEAIGFMSFRFLKLSLQFPMKKISSCLKNGGELRALENEFITKLEIKNETLNEGLLKLSVDLFPQHFDRLKVDQFMRRNLRLNESRPVNYDDKLSKETLRLLCEKEWLLMSRY